MKNAPHNSIYSHLHFGLNINIFEKLLLPWLHHYKITWAYVLQYLLLLIYLFIFLI